MHPLWCTKMSYLHESWLRPLVLSGDMLRIRGLVLLTIINIVHQVSTEQIINTNGWIPMSRNDIYKQIRRVSTVHPIYRTTKPPMHYANNLVQRKINSKKDFRDFKESLEELNENPFDSVTLAFKTNISDQAIVNSYENIRKAKKMWNDSVEISANNLEIPKINSKISVSDEDYSIKDVKTAVAATSNTYEVTEDTYKSFATESAYTTNNVEYNYNPPRDGNQNLTSTFYKILSKYNINSKDKLQNYDLSLHRKVQTPSSSAYRAPLLHGYNNLNHLPVDPLLAVFLSNYGFYLPSLYGIKANYNNLYGYLASNNIHNNRPFGLYKVFSDTDSWN